MSVILRATIIAAVALGTVCASAASADKPVWQRIHLTPAAPRESYDFPVYANHPLNQDLSAIREVIVIQHGIQRDGDHYFEAAMDLLKKSGRDPEQILIMAPNFPGTPDKNKGFDGMPVWSVQGWTGGDNAVTGMPPGTGLSSLTVIDDLIALVADKSRTPQLQRITIAGHSGGGQLVHRYAVLNSVDEKIRARGLELSYLIANPSSYLYFTPERPSGNTFANYDSQLCKDYDQYRYGMKGMVSYANGMDGIALFQRYRQRQVTYLAGTADNDPNHRVLDKSCAAEAEGPTRIERARAYWRYELYLAGQALPQHRRYEVTDVGHDQGKMFGSQCGMQILFHVNSTTNPSGAACQPIELTIPRSSGSPSP